MEAKIHNGAKLIVIDPRFTRTASVADFYTPIRSGTDITFLSGVILYLLNNEKFNREYTEAYTNASLIVREDYSFEDGLFSGYDAEKRKYDKTSWNYELDENGFAKRDTTLQHPRCVWNLLKQHVSRYTPDVVENICGTPKADFLKVCEYIAETSARINRVVPVRARLDAALHRRAEHPYHGDDPAAARQHGDGRRRRERPARSLQHSGSDRPRPAVAEPAGLYDAAERETDRPANLPDRQHAEAAAERPGELLGQLSEVLRLNDESLLGDKATAENSWGFDWLPKWDKGYDVLQYFEMMNQGKVNGYICQGFNPVASFPNKNKVVASLSKLKFLVTIDPLNTETSTFWQNHGESNDVDPSKIQTEVFRLPSTCFAEENGSIVNSGRWLQWHWKGADAPGIASPMAKSSPVSSYACVRCTPKRRPAPEPVLNMTWNYSTPHEPASEEVAMESNGKALADITDPATGAVIEERPAAQLLRAAAR
jgi:formate dehydrogenase major subunit